MSRKNVSEKLKVFTYENKSKRLFQKMAILSGIAVGGLTRLTGNMYLPAGALTFGILTDNLLNDDPGFGLNKKIHLTHAAAMLIPYTDKIIEKGIEYGPQIYDAIHNLS